MPISATGSKTPGRRREAGFTLVELMVVVTIIGLASAAVVWAMPDRRGRLVDEATRFAVRVRAAQDSAVVNAAPVSLWVTRGGYGFDRRVSGGWVPVADKPLRVERWAEGTRPEIADTSGRLRVTFDVTGLADRPADLKLARDRVETVVRIGADGSVRVDG